MSTPPEPRSRQLPRPPSGPLPGRFRQRGAAAVLTAISLLLLVPVLALTVNIGQLYYAQRDLEKQATLAALSAVQISSGCASGGVPALMSAITAEVTSVIAANSVDGATSVQGLLTGINGSPAIEVGTIVSTTGFRRFVPLAIGNENVTAVRVNLSRPQPVPLINLYGGGGMLYASATAEQPAYASFRIGTATAGINEGALNSLLSGLLRTNVNLTAVGYQGIARARVTLGNLAVAAGVNSLNDLLQLDLTAPEALNIVADALAATGDATSGTAAGLISGLAGQSYTNPGVIQNVFGQVFNSTGTALNPAVTSIVGTIPFVDGLGLLTALGQAASIGQTIRLPVTVNVLGLAGLGVFATIIEPEQFSNPPGRPGLGPTGTPYTTAQSSQVRLAVRLLVSVPLITNVRLAIDIEAANGLAELLSVNCPSMTNNQPRALIQSTTSLIRATVGTFTGSPTANPPQLPSSGPAATLIGIPLLTSTVRQSQNDGGTRHPAQLASGPTFPLALPALSSSTNLTTLITSALGSSLSPLGPLLAAVLSPVVLLVDALLDPLLATLGVSLGESAVTVDSITTQRPSIVNTCLPGTVNC